MFHEVRSESFMVSTMLFKRNIIPKLWGKFYFIQRCVTHDFNTDSIQSQSIPRHVTSIITIIYNHAFARNLLVAVDLATAWISHPSPLLDGWRTSNSGHLKCICSICWNNTLHFSDTYILFTTSITLHLQCSSTSYYHLTDCYCLLTSVTTLPVILALQSHNLCSYLYCLSHIATWMNDQTIPYSYN